VLRYGWDKLSFYSSTGDTGLRPGYYPRSLLWEFLRCPHIPLDNCLILIRMACGVSGGFMAWLFALFTFLMDGSIFQYLLCRTCCFHQAPCHETICCICYSLCCLARRTLGYPERRFNKGMPNNVRKCRKLLSEICVKSCT
jgi:hypothetical protein